MKEYKNTEVPDIATLRDLISKAKSVGEMNDLRNACVKWMHEETSILKEWQDKYWSLKKCPTCGKVR
jgi:hypothetical protein